MFDVRPPSGREPEKRRLNLLSRGLRSAAPLATIVRPAGEAQPALTPAPSPKGSGK